MVSPSKIVLSYSWLLPRDNVTIIPSTPGVKWPIHSISLYRIFSHLGIYQWTCSPHSPQGTTPIIYIFRSRTSSLSSRYSITRGMIGGCTCFLHSNSELGLKETIITQNLLTQPDNRHHYVDRFHLFAWGLLSLNISKQQVYFQKKLAEPPLTVLYDGRWRIFKSSEQWISSIQSTAPWLTWFLHILCIVKELHILCIVKELAFQRISHWLICISVFSLFHGKKGGGASRIRPMAGELSKVIGQH
jgi:hypothetical protein